MNAFSFPSCQRCSCHKAVLFVGKGFLEIKNKQHKELKCSVITGKRHIRTLALRSQMRFSLKPKELEQRDTRTEKKNQIRKVEKRLSTACLNAKGKSFSAVVEL